MKRRPTPKREWQPLMAAPLVPKTEQQRAAMRAFAESHGYNADAVNDLMDEDRELWVNDRYVVSVTRGPGGHPSHLSIRRADRKTDFPWRHLQRIKNELAGDECEAVELFPAESRLIDTANQRWLWCMEPGEVIPLGFHEGRHVLTPEEAAAVGARQAAL